MRELDEAEGRLIPGTAAAIRPFFSPDGQWIGYNDERRSTLKRVSLAGGVPVRVCGSVGESYGATWGPDDTIVFARDSSSGLWQVSAAGGEPRELTKPDRAQGEKTHRNPHYLPGGKAVLFTVGTNRLASYGRCQDRSARACQREPPHPDRRRNRRRLRGVRPPRVPARDLHPCRAFRPRAPGGDGRRPWRWSRACSRNHAMERLRSRWLAQGLWSTGPTKEAAQRLVVVDRAGRARPLSPFVEGLSSSLGCRPMGVPLLSEDRGQRPGLALRHRARVLLPGHVRVGQHQLRSGPPTESLSSSRRAPAGSSIACARTAAERPSASRWPGTGRSVSRLRCGRRTFWPTAEVGKNSREDIWIAPLEAGGEAAGLPADAGSAKGCPAFSPERPLTRLRVGRIGAG